MRRFPVLAAAMLFAAQAFAPPVFNRSEEALKRCMEKAGQTRTESAT